MWFTRHKLRLRGAFGAYPRPFWTLVGVTFIDRLGGALLYPFFALCITMRFGVGMTQVGVLIAIFAISSFVGQMLGGVLSDRLGRKGMLIFSLISTSFTSVLMGLVDSLAAFFLLAAFVGTLTEAGPPARPWWPICSPSGNGPRGLASCGWPSTCRSPSALSWGACWPANHTSTCSWRTPW